MLSTASEKTVRILEITRAMVTARSSEELLRAFLQPLWEADQSASAVLLDITDARAENGNPVVDIFASANSHADETPIVPVGRYYLSEISIPIELTSDTETFYHFDLDRTDSFVPDLLVHRWRDQGWRSVTFFVLKDPVDSAIALVVNRCNERVTGVAEHRHLYSELIPMMASLAHNHRHLWISERRLELTQALYEANRRLLVAKDYDETLNVIFAFASQSGAKVASLFSVELTESGRPTWGSIIARAGAEQGVGSAVGTRYHLPDLPFAQLWLDLEDDVLAISDAINDVRADTSTHELWRQLGIGASILMPLRLHGQWIGLLSVNWDTRHLFTTSEKVFYRALSTQVATVLENQRLRAAERVAMEKLATEEAQYRLLADNATDMITRTLPDTTLTYVSPSSLSLLGWAPEELLGTVSLNLLHPDDINRDASSPQRETVDHLETRFRLRRRDGSYIWAEATVRFIYNEDGTLRERLSVTRDISKRKAAEDHVITLNAQLTEQAAKLEAANRELEAFTYSVSHDLRAPLRAMDGFSKILGEKYRDDIPEEARRYLDRIRVNAVQMGALIDDLLTLSRVTKRTLDKRECAMAQIARTAYHEATTEQDAQRMEFVLADLPNSEGDSNLIKQVYINLFTNAVKFTRGRAEATIEVGASGEVRGNPVYFVRDNGIGFDMQYADKIFGVFQRLHDSRQYEGTGVGLAIVQRIIRRHDGQVWVSSVPGEGTTFYFTLGGSDGRTDG